MGNTVGVSHYRAHLANHCIEKLRTTFKPGWFMALGSFLKPGSGPGIIFSGVDYAVWQGVIL